MSDPARRSNILMFLTDDHAGWAMHCAGATALDTPSMDHIARRGVRFARASCVSPVCSPARASFWTGTLPSWHGVHDHVTDHQVDPEHRHPGIGDQPTVAEALQAAGYRTGLVGKWHCHRAPRWTRRPGFDRWFSMAGGTNARFGNQPFIDEEREVERHGHQAPILTEEAVRFLREDDPRPFFLCVGFTDTHSPFQAGPERLVERYRERDLGWPEEARPAHIGHPKLPAEAAGGGDLAEANAEYAAAVTHIDEQVGRLLWWLRRHGRERETWIVFSSDHGELLGDHHRMFKSSFLEGSARVPLVVRPPPGSPCPRGQRRDELVDLIDILPTCCGLADLAVDPEVDGRDLGPLVRGESPGWRERWHGECHGGAGRECLTDGRYTYLWDARDGHELLFDLSDDPTECRDLAARSDHAALLARWRAHLVEELDGRGCGLVADGALVSGAALAPTRRELLDAAGDPSGPFVG